MKAGFNGLRVVAELGSFFESAGGEKLLDYEKKLGKKLAAQASALCLYDIRKMEERQIFQLMKSHGHMVSGDLVWRIT